MIDTIKLTLQDYEISDAPNLTLEHSPTDLATGEARSTYPLWKSGSGYVEGCRAYHNADTFNVTIKPPSPREPAVIGAYVQFSVPKVSNGDNYHPADTAATKAAVESMGKELASIGIKTNINTAKVSRLDTFKNVLTADAYPTYHPVLSLLQGQRMAKRDYGTTFLWANTQQEVCVYDKLAEMAARKQSTDGYAPNTIRFEHRLLKARKVQDTLGMTTIGDVLSDLGHVSETYRANMERQLFKRTVSDVEQLSAQQVEDELRFFIERGDRYWFQSWLNARALRGMITDMDAVLTAVSKVSNRNTKMRIKNQIDTARMDAMALQTAFPTQRTMGQLYTELRDKVLAA